jgi:ribosomal subunit interface protein
MLQRFELSGVHTTIDPALNKYVTKKIGNIDKYIPKYCLGSAAADVVLKEDKAQATDNFTCEVNLHLPNQSIIIKESGLNIYAAVDIAEAKLKLQLKKYKDVFAGNKNRRHLMGRFLRKEA